jgi:hypothetical protein
MRSSAQRGRAEQTLSDSHSSQVVKLHRHGEILPKEANRITSASPVDKLSADEGGIVQLENGFLVIKVLARGTTALTVFPRV